MESALLFAATSFCAFAFAAHVWSVAAVALRSRRAPPSQPYTCPAVTVIRPVCGLENFVEETLASTFRLRGAYEIVFCVADPADPVVPVVRALMARYPAIPSRLLIGDDAISKNPKLNNVAKGWDAAAFPWIAMVDSNVLMPPDSFARLFAVWDAKTGIVCSPPVGAAPDGWWAELECAFLNTYQARWQYFADEIGLGFAQGKVMFLRRDLLEPEGGIRALGADLAEDAAATKLVRRSGLEVALTKTAVTQPLGHRSFAEVWSRQLRWSRLRRDTFKLYFVPEVLSGSVPPIAAGVFAAVAWGYAPAAAVLSMAAVWYGAEALLAVAAGWHLSRRSPLTWIARDLMIPVLWLSSWTGNGFVWRGNQMRVADRARAA